MNHIKSYKLFEGIKFNNNISESEQNQLNDILLPFLDRGYEIECNFGFGILSKKMFEIKILGRLDIYKIIDDLKFVISYLETEFSFINIRAMGYFYTKSIGRLNLNGYDTHALTQVAIIGHIN